jgi:D-alanine-D-alanine ligase
MKIAVLYGGKSGEHEVSLLSAGSVVRNLRRNHKLVLIGIDRAGSWFLQPDSVWESAREGAGPLELRTNCPMVVIVPGAGLRVYGAYGSSDLQLDAVFPVLHGSFGEDGTIQGLLECAGLAYVGADVLGSAIGMDKDVSMTLWSAAGLPVIPFMTVHTTNLSTVQLADLQEAAVQRFGWPLFIKPACSGSSVGTAKVSSASGFATAMQSAMRYGAKVIIEPFLQARELECSVIGNDQPRAFKPGEITPNHEYYDYDAKYLDPDGAQFAVPAILPEETRQRVMELALQAYRTAHLCGMARIDFFMDKRDGTIYLNEANTIPGFTHISMFPRMCEADGLAYPDLLDELMQLAIDRHTHTSTFRYQRD